MENEVRAVLEGRRRRSAVHGDGVTTDLEDARELLEHLTLESQAGEAELEAGAPVLLDLLPALDATDRGCEQQCAVGVHVARGCDVLLLERGHELLGRLLDLVLHRREARPTELQNGYIRAFTP